MVFFRGNENQKDFKTFPTTNQIFTPKKLRLHFQKKGKWILLLLYFSFIKTIYFRNYTSLELMWKRIPAQLFIKRYIFSRENIFPFLNWNLFFNFSWEKISSQQFFLVENVGNPDFSQVYDIGNDIRHIETWKIYSKFINIRKKSTYFFTFKFCTKAMLISLWRAQKSWKWAVYWKIYSE